MIKLDDNLLQELGLGILPPEEKKKMLAHVYETLEMRVGMELAKQMTDAQLNEFEQFINRNDEAGALHWLETNFPNYKQVVADEFEKLKLEIKQVAPQIVSGAMQAAQADPAAFAAPGGQPQQGQVVQPQQYSQDQPQPQYQQPAPAQYPPQPQQYPAPQQPQQPYMPPATPDPQAPQQYPPQQPPAPGY